jgi:hypothetical protein
MVEEGVYVKVSYEKVTTPDCVEVGITMKSILEHTKSGNMITFYSMALSGVVFLLLLGRFIFSVLIMLIDGKPR